MKEKAGKSASFLERIVGLFKRRICKHMFAIEDLKFTGIPEPKKPSGSDSYKKSAWDKYFDEYWNGDWNKKRVKWPCAICGEVFYAHCGLDISPKNGFIFRRK